MLCETHRSHCGNTGSLSTSQQKPLLPIKPSAPNTSHFTKQKHCWYSSITSKRSTPCQFAFNLLRCFYKNETGLEKTDEPFFRIVIVQSWCACAHSHLVCRTLSLRIRIRCTIQTDWMHRNMCCSPCFRNILNILSDLCIYLHSTISIKSQYLQVCVVTELPLKGHVACKEFSSMYLEASSVIEQHSSYPVWEYRKWFVWKDVVPWGTSSLIYKEF